MIQVQNISKAFADKQVLRGISATFESGKTNLIIGQSGSGKTVLIKSILGIHEVDSGEIFYDERELTQMNNKQRKLLRQEIGMLFQGSALFDSLTVEENVLFPLDMFTKKSKKEKLSRADFCLQRVQLEHVRKLYPSEISGGQQKRVAIARAIALNPKYLFCDEPNSGLDPSTSIVIDDLIQEITQEYNITTIVNTHDMNSVLQIGENIIFVYQGQVEWQGNKNDILSLQNKKASDFIFASAVMRKIRAK